jgi:chemotaxis protein histidine kinase CheA
MAISKQQIILEIDADTGEVLKATSDLQKNMEGVAEAANDAAEATESIGTAGADAGSKLKKAGQTGTSAFKGLGAAIKATGIGLLVALLAKLVVAFTENKKVADALGVATAALGVIFNGIVDAGSKIASNLIEAFNNPQQAIDGFKQRLEGVGNYIKLLGSTIFGGFKLQLLSIKEGLIEGAIAAKEFLGGDATELRESLKQVQEEQEKIRQAQEENKRALAEPFVNAAEAVKEYVTQTATAVKQATALERQLQKLSDAERNLAVTTAQSRAEVEELKRQRDDARLSIEERIAAAEKAAAIDKQIADENVRISEQRAELLRREIELQGETEERLQAVADAEIAAADARTASLTLQTELQNSLFALNEEARAQQEEQAALEAEEAQAALDAFLDRLQKEKEAKDKAAAEDKARRDQEIANELAAAQQRVAIAQGTLGALQGLTSAFAKDTEKSQKKAFKINKALQIAQATIQTYQSATAAYASQLTIPTPDAPIRASIAAGAAIASGLAQIAVISKTKFQGGGGTPSAPSASTGGLGGVSTPTGAGGGTQPPQLDLGFLGEGAGQEGPIQAYVVSENVSNAQQANQKIKEQAAL